MGKTLLAIYRAKKAWIFYYEIVNRMECNDQFSIQRISCVEIHNWAISVDLEQTKWFHIWKKKKCEDFLYAKIIHQGGDCILMIMTKLFSMKLLTLEIFRKNKTQ